MKVKKRVIHLLDALSEPLPVMQHSIINLIGYTDEFYVWEKFSSVNKDLRHITNSIKRLSIRTNKPVSNDEDPNT